MNRFAPLVLMWFCTRTFVPGVSAATPSPKNEVKGKTPGIELAIQASQVTGIAISPLVGVSGVGADRYFTAHTAEEKAALPWFAPIKLWLPAMLLVAVGARKDSIAAVIPPWVALGSPFIAPSTTLESHRAARGGVGMVQRGALDLPWPLTLLMVPLSIAVFAVVGVVGHAINILILLSPRGGVDTALKALRTAGLTHRKGLFFSAVLGFDKTVAQTDRLRLLSPRYRGHEDIFARTYQFSGPCEVGLCKTWGWIKEGVGLRAKQLPAAGWP